MQNNASSQWIVRPAPCASPRLRLLCVPYAGGGASLFRRWPGFLPSDVEILAVQLPGREKRLNHPPCADLRVIVDNLLTALCPFLDRPLAMFGYSMGTRIAFELARKLRARDGMEPAHLLMAACKAPQIPEPPNPRFLLPDAEFKEALRRLGGTPDEVLDNDELMDLFLPAVRADFALKESYVHQPCAPFACPITAFCGDRDDEAPPDEVSPWHTQTSGEFRMRIFEGRHFFMHDNFNAFLSAIALALESRTALPVPRSTPDMPRGYIHAS